MEPTGKHNREGAFDLSTEEMLQSLDSSPPEQADDPTASSNPGTLVLSRSALKHNHAALMDPPSSDAPITVTGVNTRYTAPDDAPLSESSMADGQGDKG